MASGIFVSYRRDDTRHVAGRLADDLAPHFGQDNIFRDIEAIDPGVDFVEALEGALGSCVVMLTLIGPHWLDVRDAKGVRRLDNPKDWIRAEIAAALSRGVRVIPVLVEGAALPDEQSLPPEMQALCRRQALDLADNRWRGDLLRLVETLARVPGLKRLSVADSQRGGASVDRSPPPVAPPPVAPARRGNSQLWMGVGIGVLGLLGVAYMVDMSESDSAVTGARPLIGNLGNAPPAAGLDPQPSGGDAPPPSPTIPNLAGAWRGVEGTSFQFLQRGDQVSFAAYANGQQIGAGNGQLQESMLHVAMTMQMPGMAPINYQCSLQAAADYRAYNGSCQGSDGSQTPAQMFR